MVILHVDHVVPVSTGGSDDVGNLITSCSDCNLGKSDSVLPGIESKPTLTPEQAVARNEQLEAYYDQLKEQAFQSAEAVDRIFELWALLDGQDMAADKFMLPKQLFDAVPRFLERLPEEEVADAVRKAFSRKGSEREWSRFKYFCGICWRKIKGEAPKGT